MKEVVFVGSSLDDLRRFPTDAKHDMGQQIAMIQSGMDPRHWRPMPTVGSGVRELRVRIAGNAYRSMYTTTLGDAVYILHVFVKKSQKTAKADIDIAKKRFREVIRETRQYRNRCS